MKKILLIFCLLLSISLFSQEEKRLALVIGNANYEKGELKNPVNDARLVASTLDSLNFDVILKENLSTKREMLSAVKEFGIKRPEYDVAFVYYAGHGIQVEDENFLLPTKEVFEEEFDVMDYGVSVQNIMRYLRSQSNEVNILILDACRDNPFESTWNATRSLKGGGLAKIPPPTGSLIAFSTDSGQTAPDGNDQNSVYTTSLTKNMLLEDTSIDQVFRNVRTEVLAETKGNQRPVEATQLTGQAFYLKSSTFEKDFNQIDEYLIYNNIDLALELSNKIITKDNKNWKAYTKKAHALTVLKRYTEAEENYELAIKFNSNEIEPYMGYYMDPEGNINYVGLLNLHEAGHVKSSDKNKLSNLFEDLFELGKNNPYYFRLYTQVQFELKGDNWDNWKLNFSKTLEQYESINEDDIKFYSNKIFFHSGNYDPLFNYQTLLLERKMHFYWDQHRFSEKNGEPKEIANQFLQKIVEETESFIKINKEKLKNNSFELTASSFWLEQVYEKIKNWNRLIELLELQKYSNGILPKINANMQLIKFYNLEADFKKSFIALEELHEIIRSEELSVFLYNYYVGDVYLNLIINYYSIKNDNFKTMSLIDEVFNIIEKDFLKNKDLFIVNGSTYQINSSPNKYNLFSSTYIEIFQYIKYLINLKYERFDEANDDYKKTIALFEYNGVSYDEYEIKIKNTKTKLIGTELLNHYNDLYYFFSEESEVFEVLARLVGSDSSLSRFKLNVILDNVLPTAPTWSNYSKK